MPVVRISPNLTESHRTSGILKFCICFSFQISPNQLQGSRRFQMNFAFDARYFAFQDKLCSVNTPGCKGISENRELHTCTIFSKILEDFFETAWQEFRYSYVNLEVLVSTTILDKSSTCTNLVNQRFVYVRVHQLIILFNTLAIIHEKHDVI